MQPQAGALRAPTRPKSGVDPSPRERWLRRARRGVGRWLVDHATPPVRTKPGGIAMFHFGRCGSTVLAGMLARHPGLHWDHEVFAGHALLAPAHARGDVTAWSNSRHFPYAPLPYLMRRMRWAGRRRYGFETKFHHVRANGLTLEGYLAALRRLGFERYVLLTRRNLLRVAVSSLRAVTDGPHLRVGAATQARALPLDLEAVRISGQCLPLTGFFEQWERDCDALRALVPGDALLELVYEEDIASGPERAYRRVCEFAGLEPQPVAPRQQRTNPFALREMVANYDELEAALAGTRWGWMLTAD